METIIYRFPLDVAKSGVQKTLQGFGTGDTISRKLAITFVNGSKTFMIDADHTEAMMYVEDPATGIVSINQCEIVDNTVYYLVQKSDVRSAGFEQMQCKLIYTNPKTGATKVIAAPKFQIEIDETENLDDIIQAELDKRTFDGSFTALEMGVARAQAYYHTRLVQIEFDEEFIFHAYYADGVEYVNDQMRDAYDEVMTAREEVANNAEMANEAAVQADYAAAVAKSSASEAERFREICEQAVEEVVKTSAYATFEVNFETGELEYDSINYTFEINPETGDLEYVLKEVE